LLVALTYLLIVWGAVVRSSGSGLGCPDWPLCHGQIIPPFRKDVLIEYTHRLLASLVGFLTLGFAILVWLKKELRILIGKWCGVALALLFVQVGLGGVTVKTELHPYVVATHLGVALVFLAVIFYMTLLVRSWTSAHQHISTSVQKSIWYRLSHYTLTVLFLQMILGSLVAASNAGLACPDFPTCQGAWIPQLTGLVGLHFLHRVGALLVLFMVCLLVVGKWGRGAVRFIFLLAVFQILLGIGNVLWGLPLWMRITHLGVAVLLFLALMVSTYELRRESQ